MSTLHYDAAGAHPAVPNVDGRFVLVDGELRPWTGTAQPVVSPVSALLHQHRQCARARSRDRRRCGVRTARRWRSARTPCATPPALVKQLPRLPRPTITGAVSGPR